MYKQGMLTKTGSEAKFLKSLEKGVKISVKQAKAWFKLKNPPAAILRFKQAGLPICYTYKASKNQKFNTVTYSL